MAVLKTTSPWPSTWAPRARPAKERPSSRTRAAWRGAGSGIAAPHDRRRVLAVRLPEDDLDALVPGRRHVLAHVVGADRQLPVAPVDQHGQLDGARPAE